MISQMEHVSEPANGDISYLCLLLKNQKATAAEGSSKRKGRRPAVPRDAKKKKKATTVPAQKKATKGPAEKEATTGLAPSKESTKGAIKSKIIQKHHARRSIVMFNFITQLSQLLLIMFEQMSNHNHSVGAGSNMHRRKCRLQYYQIQFIRRQRN